MEKYETTVRKIERIEFLENLVEQKKGEIADIKSETAALRKTNGREDRAEKDPKIANLNAKLREAEAALKNGKAEVRGLKESAKEELLELYLTADAPKDIEDAYLRLTGGREAIESAETAGGVFGETEVVAVVTTADRKLRGKVCKLVKAGIREDGKTVVKPKIVAYYYSPYEAEGLEREADDSVKPELKRQTKNRFYNYFRDAFFTKKSFYALFFGLLYGGFAVWAAAGGFGERLFIGGQKILPAAIFVATAAYFAVSVCDGTGGYADNFALLCVIVSAFAFPCAFTYKNVYRALIFPVAACVSGVGFALIRGSLYTKIRLGGENTVALKLFAAFSGVVAAFVFRSAYPVKSYFYALYYSAAAIAAICLIMLFIKRGGFFKNCLISASFAFLTFTIMRPPVTLAYISFAVGTVCLVALAAREITDKRKSANTEVQSK